MQYIDTSALVPFYIEEAASEQVERYLLSIPPGKLALSKWAMLEFRGALARLERMGLISSADAMRIMSELASDAEEAFEMIVHDASDFDAAIDLVRESGARLRPGDALHIATARRVGVSRLVSLDRELIESATALGVEASPPE